MHNTENYLQRMPNKSKLLPILTNNTKNKHKEVKKSSKF